MLNIKLSKLRKKVKKVYLIYNYYRISIINENILYIAKKETKKKSSPNSLEL